MLFKKDIEPSCIYCSHGVRLTTDKIGCIKHGVVCTADMCSKFSYDPLKRIPPRPKKLNSFKFTDEDFIL